jgi:hypothetical protein
MFIKAMKEKLEGWIEDLKFNFSQSESGSYTTKILAPLAVILIIMLAFGIYWSEEPEAFDVIAVAAKNVDETKQKLTTGSYTTSAIIHAMETLLDKPGGYLSNDVTPPSIFLDNIPNWEFGVLVQVRDLSQAMRQEFSRSQSQSTEDKDLIIAEPQFNFDSSSWILPATEGEYREGVNALYRYLARLQNPANQDAQFYARADNLRDWLDQAEKRLGSMSQRLSASVGQTRFNTDLAGDADAVQSTESSSQIAVKTPWSEIDDVFYEARGAAWALMHFMKAIEQDFEPILIKKNALISLRQIIRELEATQEPLWSPMIMNGSGFGLFANHSLVMASYISRANAAMIDLKNLMQQG